MDIEIIDSAAMVEGAKAHYASRVKGWAKVGPRVPAMLRWEDLPPDAQKAAIDHFTEGYKAVVAQRRCGGSASGSAGGSNGARSERAPLKAYDKARVGSVGIEDEHLRPTRRDRGASPVPWEISWEPPRDHSSGHDVYQFETRPGDVGYAADEKSPLACDEAPADKPGWGDLLAQHEARIAALIQNVMEIERDASLSIGRHLTNAREKLSLAMGECIAQQA